MLRALADGTRRHILSLVARGERSAGEIAAAFPLTRPAISQHLGVLLASDLLVMRRQGTRRLYRANRRALAQLKAEISAIWDDHLLRLKRVAEAAERKRPR